MEESNKFNLRILHDFSSIDLREENEIEILKINPFNKFSRNWNLINAN